MKLKNILIYSILIFTSTFALVKFSQRHLKHSLTQSLDQSSQQLSNPVFSFQSEFSQYVVDNNSINKQLISSIAKELKLDTNGYANFGAFDFVRPSKIIFTFADINLLSVPEKQHLLNRHLDANKQIIAGIKSNFNQNTKTLNYTLYNFWC